MTQAYDQQPDRDLIPPGEYRARPLSTSFGYTKNTGSEELVISFEVSEGDWTGHTLYGRLYFGEKSMQNVTPNALKALGFTGDFLELCAEHIADASTIFPNEVRLTVEHDTYNGKTSAKVKWINSLYRTGGLKPAAQPLATKEKRDFAQRMAALTSGMFGQGTGPKATAHTSSAAARAARPAPQQQPADYDSHGELPAADDIPF